MNKVLKNTIKFFLPISVYRKWKKKYVETRMSQRYTIIMDVSKTFPIMSRIKEDTWETVHFPEQYELSKAFDLSCYHPAKYISKIDNASVSHNSDIVISQLGVVWDKYDDHVFCKTIPQDKNLLRIENDNLQVSNPVKSVPAKGNVISLLGVYADIWAHFLTQFLPKLYFAERAGLLDEETTLLVPPYEDIQIKECISRVIQNHPKVHIIEAEASCDYVCEHLYYIPTIVTLANHSTYLTPYDCVMPKCVLDILRDNLVKPLIKESKEIQKQWGDKIYLVRRGTYRGVTNVDELETYFLNKGFELVEPHKLSLVEKVAMFNRAKEVVGPCSASWSNIIFCDGAKCLLIYPMGRAMDTYPHYLSGVGKVQTMNLIGYDIALNMQPDYFVSIEKVDAAYKQLLANDNSEK